MAPNWNAGGLRAAHRAELDRAGSGERASGQSGLAQEGASVKHAGREPCDLVFLDPPYRSGVAAAAMTALAEAGWLAKPAIVTVEVAYNEDVAPPAGFAALDERRYGAAKILIFKYVA